MWLEFIRNNEGDGDPVAKKRHDLLRLYLAISLSLHCFH